MRLGVTLKALKRRNPVLFISALIIICITVLIGHGVYFAIFETKLSEKVALKLSPDERIVRAYRLAYFTDISLSEEAIEQIK